jgi:hypothetical protein
MRRSFCLGGLVGISVLTVIAGCGYEMAHEGARGPEVSQSGLAERMAADSAGNVAAEGKDGAAKDGRAAVQRRIVYKNTLDLVVEDFTDTPRQVLALRDRFGAYIADSQVYGHSGSPRHAYWKLRVPVARFDDFLAEARKLGELRNERQEAEDITEKYYDVDARLRNKKKQEARLLELLADRTAKLEDVVKVETEMARVREEIERHEGQLRLLDSLSAMATVTLQVQEIKNYLPDDSAGLATRIGRAWSGSLAGLRTTGENALIVLIALAPWIVVLGVMVAAMVLALRRLRRSRLAARS